MEGENGADFPGWIGWGMEWLMGWLDRGQRVRGEGSRLPTEIRT